MSATKCSPPYTSANAIARVYVARTARTAHPAGQKNSSSMNGYAAWRDGMAATVLTRLEFSYTDCIDDTPRRSQTDGTIRSTAPR